MGKRTEFTEAIKDLIAYMISEGERPILDYALRSKEEQKRLFEAGKSRCDGEVKISKHQRGLAVDIYLFKSDGTGLDFNKEKAVKYHEFWETLGGQAMIEWDQGHYEF